MKSNELNSQRKYEFSPLNKKPNEIDFNMISTKEKIENNHFKQPIQNEFLKIFKQLFKVNVPKNKINSDKFAKSLITILDSVYFEVVVIVCICANLFVLAMNLPNRNQMTSHFFSNMNFLH